MTKSQTFTLTTSENVTTFTLTGAAVNSTTAFTLKVTQGTTPYTVDLDSFRTTSNAVIPVYWPGGIAPTMTNVASKTDIYSFMTFDGGASLYGVVGGQNFS